MQWFLIILVAFGLFGRKSSATQNEECNLPMELINEIASYAPVINNIINATIYGEHKGSTYNRLAYFADHFGHRLTGTSNLEDAIDFIINEFVAIGLENVHGENVTVPRWMRGLESATLIEPRYKPLTMLGLGNSIGTFQEGIRAEALVVTSFNELRNVSHLVKDKIVVYNQEFITYGISSEYRGNGAWMAAQYGAVAVLIRSLTPFSFNNPHTGGQNYKENITKIPAASITVDDAQMLYRMQMRGDRIVIEMKMDATILPSGTSRNTVAEIIGSSQPNKVVVISGHLDSWDVGQGIVDDAGGCFISWNAMAILKSMGLRARRTIRTILWTAEEQGLVGAFAYEAAHRNETPNLNFVMEADEGILSPNGIGYTGLPYGACILQEILKLLSPINTTTLVQPSGGPDISVWLEQGIPGASINNALDNYFWYHHSPADTMEGETPEDLDRATILWATVAYIVADLSVDMPRNITTRYEYSNKIRQSTTTLKYY